MKSLPAIITCLSRLEGKPNGPAIRRSKKRSTKVYQTTNYLQKRPLRETEVN